MKKIFLSLSFLSVLALSSCGDKAAADINVSDISSECECVESMNIVMKEMLAKMDGKKLSEMSEEDKNSFKEKNKALEEKSEEIIKHCSEKFPDMKKAEDIKDCDAVEEYKKTMEEVRNVL